MLLTQESENEAFMSVWNRITPELLTPRIFLEKSWRLNGGTINHYCYLARPFPKYRLKALYNCFKDHLEQNDIPIDQKTLVGGRLHRYEPKPVLELRRFKVNPAILAGRVRDVYGYRLTYRPSWLGFTMVFWTRVVCITVYKNHVLDDPVSFITSFLNDAINYPRHVVLETVEKGTVEHLLKEHDQVRVNEQRGWRIEL